MQGSAVVTRGDGDGDGDGDTGGGCRDSAVVFSGSQRRLPAVSGPLFSFLSYASKRVDTR